MNKKRENLKNRTKNLIKQNKGEEVIEYEPKKKNFHKTLLKIIAYEYLICGLLVSVATNKLYAYENKTQKNMIISQQITIENLSKPQEVVETKVEEPKVVEQVQKNEEFETNKTYLGKFKITHYCACKKCCGIYADGITASGKKAVQGTTIAVDTKVIKLGSKIYIDGYGHFEAQDTGSAIKGNTIDVFIADHNEALKLGVQYKDVYLEK